MQSGTIKIGTNLKIYICMYNRLQLLFFTTFSLHVTLLKPLLENYYSIYPLYSLDCIQSFNCCWEFGIIYCDTKIRNAHSIQPAPFLTETRVCKFTLFRLPSKQRFTICLLVLSCIVHFFILHIQNCLCIMYIM